MEEMAVRPPALLQVSHQTDRRRRHLRPPFSTVPEAGPRKGVPGELARPYGCGSRRRRRSGAFLKPCPPPQHHRHSGRRMPAPRVPGGRRSTTTTPGTTSVASTRVASWSRRAAPNASDRFHAVSCGCIEEGVWPVGGCQPAAFKETLISGNRCAPSRRLSSGPVLYRLRTRTHTHVLKPGLQFRDDSGDAT